MVFGNPASEQIQLNEATIWAGSPNNNPNPAALKAIPELRQLIFAGKYEEAQALATQKVMSATNQGMPFQPFGDLRISFPGHTRYTDYYRDLIWTRHVRW
jgi:alpha-L-fucosidase 2